MCVYFIMCNKIVLRNRFLVREHGYISSALVHDFLSIISIRCAKSTVKNIGKAFSGAFGVFHDRSDFSYWLNK